MMREMESEKLFQFRVKFEFTSSSSCVSQECAPRKLVTHHRPLRISDISHGLFTHVNNNVKTWMLLSFGCCKLKQTIQFFMNECVSATVDACIFFRDDDVFDRLRRFFFAERWKNKNQVTLDSQLKPVNYEFKINWYRSDKRGRRDMTHLAFIFISLDVQNNQSVHQQLYVLAWNISCLSTS